MGQPHKTHPGPNLVLNSRRVGRGHWHNLSSLQNEGWLSCPLWLFSDPLCIPSNLGRLTFQPRETPDLYPTLPPISPNLPLPRVIRSQFPGPTRKTGSGERTCDHHWGWRLQRNGIWGQRWRLGTLGRELGSEGRGFENGARSLGGGH